MQHYESYKPSGLDWLGDIPSHWGLKKSKFLWREREDRSLLGDEELLSVSQYSGVAPRDGDSRSESLEDYKRCEPNDLVINIMLAWMSGLGISKYSGIVSPAYCVYRQLEGHNPAYFDYLYRTPQYLAEFARRSKGIVPSRWRMYTEDFGQILSLLPPRNEQDRIVAFLDQKTAEIDAAIDKKKRLIELLSEQKAVEINRAVTCGVDDTADYASTEENWLDSLPAHWRLVPLLSIADVIDPNPSHRNPKYTNMGFPFVSTVEFDGDDDIRLESTRRVAEATVIEQEQRCHFSSASIAFSRKGTIGAVRRLPIGQRFALLDSLCVINVKEGMNVQFLYRQLVADIIRAQYAPAVRGAALKQLSVGRVRNLKVLVPPLHEQTTIAEYIDSRLDEINRVINRVRRQIDQLAELRKTLISCAVTGQVKV